MSSNTRGSGPRSTTSRTSQRQAARDNIDKHLDSYAGSGLNATINSLLKAEMDDKVPFRPDSKPPRSLSSDIQTPAMAKSLEGVSLRPHQTYASACRPPQHTEDSKPSATTSKPTWATIVNTSNQKAKSLNGAIAAPGKEVGLQHRGEKYHGLNLENIPPHLRARESGPAQRAIPESKGLPKIEQSEKSLPTTQAVGLLESSSQSSVAVETVEPPKPMNAGLGAKSAKMEMPYPCSYKECTCGFDTRKKLRRHKKEEHDWCDRCDMDFEDDLALINHRIESTLEDQGKHIACLDCGDEFVSEAGRNRHMKISHREKQELVCPGCRTIFDRGASLMAHVWYNKCPDRTGLVNSEAMSTGRVFAALELDYQRQEAEEAELARRVGASDAASTRASSVSGGVRVYDDHVFYREHDESNVQSDSPSDNDTNTDTDIETEAGRSSDGTEIPPFRGNIQRIMSQDKSLLLEQCWPSIQDSKIAKQHSENRKQSGCGLQQSSKIAVPISGLEPEAAMSDLISLSSRQRSDAPTSSSATTYRRQIQTNWDNFPFDLDPMGRFMCPFAGCEVSHDDKNVLKGHLVSGVHLGTDHRCIKCLKNFQNPVSLIAHMESSSQRCHIRETQHYTNIIYVVSGGFLDVNGDDRGEFLKDGEVRLRAPTKSELAERQKSQEMGRYRTEMSRRRDWPDIESLI